ncbi:hypothetical protein QAD02_022406, partial [Eretmocerus hayati]
MSAVTSPYGPTEMLSESVYNFATAGSRRSTGSGGSEPDNDCQQYEAASQATTATQLQLAASIQQQPAAPSPSTPTPSSGNGKPRNKRKNFKPISSRMAEISDESDDRDDETEQDCHDQTGDERDEATSGTGPEMLEYERKSLLSQVHQNSEEHRSSSGGQIKQRLNNNEVIPMDLSVATRPPSSEGDDDSGDSFRNKFILEQLRSQKVYSPHHDAQSPASESSDKSGMSGAMDQDGRMEDQDEDEQNQDGSENENETEDTEDRVRPYDEYAESAIHEFLAMYGPAEGEPVKSRLLPNNFLNPGLAGQQFQLSGGKLRVKEEKDASSTAPGSPPTPPHTPQSPSRQGNAANSNSGNPSSSGSPSNVQQQQQAAAAVAAAAAMGLHPGLVGSSLSQILAQNPALAQLLQQDPSVLTRSPQLAQLLQQSLQAHVGNAMFQQQHDRSRTDPDDARVPPTIASLAAMKVDAADPKIS